MAFKAVKMDFTDEELKKLEKRLKTQYTAAYRQIKKELAAELAELDGMTAQSRIERLSNSRKLKALCVVIAATLADAAKQGQSLIKTSTQTIFNNGFEEAAESLNFEWSPKVIEKYYTAVHTNQFTQIAFENARDEKALWAKVQSEVVTGILQGENVNAISARLKALSELQLSNTVRIARTETARYENAATQCVADYGEELGYNMWKRWTCKPDELTRDDHVRADGQEVPYDSYFIVGGEKMRFPCDSYYGASAKQICNCRCTMSVFVRQDGQTSGTTWFKRPKMYKKTQLHAKGEV